jgi:hypothetical protein
MTPNGLRERRSRERTAAWREPIVAMEVGAVRQLAREGIRGAG